ncbi:MAG: terminase large subunit domain-containing protein [Chloroflexota bacterium]
MSILTDGDRQILPLALRQNGRFDLACEWYLNFKPLPYQYAFHHIPIPNATFLGGIAVGKTRIAAASCLVDCLTIPYFQCLNTSVTARQAALAFDMFMEYYETRERIKRFVEDIVLRPWPIVTFKNFSRWEFRTSGQGARFIRGHEYDRIVCDEFGLDYDGEAIKVLRGRLRGIRPDGSPRMGRMDVITSPTDAPWLRERFDRGWTGSGKEELNNYLSMRVRTRDNTMLPAGQIDLMEAEYSDEMRAVELDAEFPDYGLSMFPRRSITACTSAALNDLMYEAVEPEQGKARTGYLLEEHFRHGITRFELPFDPSHEYVLAGDPGTDDPPRNNAAAVGVLDVTLKPNRLVYLHWVAGHGSYNPFMQSYKYAMEKYHPIIKAIDSTGTQKGIRELGFENYGIQTDGINFSTEKSPALNSLSLALTEQTIQFPLIKGLDSQLASYTLENDKKNDFPKDLTMLLAMLAYAARLTLREESKEKPKPNHYPRMARSRRR